MRSNRKFQISNIKYERAGIGNHHLIFAYLAPGLAVRTGFTWAAGSLARVAALEQQLRADQAARGTGHRLGWLVGILIAVVLTANMWMLWKAVSNQARNRVEHHFWVLSQPGATGERKLEAFTALVRSGNREWRSARLKLEAPSGRWTPAGRITITPVCTAAWRTSRRRSTGAERTACRIKTDS